MKRLSVVLFILLVIQVLFLAPALASEKMTIPAKFIQLDAGAVKWLGGQSRLHRMYYLHAYKNKVHVSLPSMSFGGSEINGSALYDDISDTVVFTIKTMTNSRYVGKIVVYVPRSTESTVNAPVYFYWSDHRPAGEGIVQFHNKFQYLFPRVIYTESPVIKEELAKALAAAYANKQAFIRLGKDYAKLRQQMSDLSSQKDSLSTL